MDSTANTLLLDTDVWGILFLPGRKIDAQILDDLETRLITADVGVEATQFILDDLQQRVARQELADVEALISALRRSITQILTPCARPLVIN